MKNLIKNLQAVNRNLTALSKKVDNIIVQVGKLEKPKSAKKTTAKAKPVKKGCCQTNRQINSGGYSFWHH